MTMSLFSDIVLCFFISRISNFGEKTFYINFKTHYISIFVCVYFIRQNNDPLKDIRILTTGPCECYMAYRDDVLRWGDDPGEPNHLGA